MPIYSIGDRASGTGAGDNNEPTDPCPNQSSPQGGGLDTNSSS